MRPSPLDEGTYLQYAWGENSFDNAALVRNVWYLLPFFAPLLGFLSCEYVVSFMHEALLVLGRQTWVSVDGGQYQAAILVPVLNGIIVPTISIALATLIASSVSTLRTRQLTIQACLNQETTILQMLCITLDKLFQNPDLDESIKNRRREIFTRLVDYASAVLSESGSDYDDKKIYSLCPQLDSVLISVYSIMDARTSLVDQTLGLVTRLNEQRSLRIAALRSAFPLLHWLVVAFLGFSLLVSFVIESDQDTLLFLDNIQLRLLFGFLVGAVTFTALLCFDLNNPFTGYFNVVPAVQELERIQRRMKRKIC